MNPNIFHTYVLKSFFDACGIKVDKIGSHGISSSYEAQIASQVAKFNNHGEIDITDKNKFGFKWIYHPWAMRDGITFDIRPTIRTQMYNPYSRNDGYPIHLDGDLTLIIKYRGNWDTGRLIIINSKWQNGMMNDENAQILYLYDDLKLQYMIVGNFKNNIFIKGTIYSYSSDGNPMLCRVVQNQKQSQNQGASSQGKNECESQSTKTTTTTQKMAKNMPIKHEYDSNYNKNFGVYCDKKRTCKVGDVEISSMLLKDKIAFIKTTIVPNILEVEGYRQVKIPPRWESAANNFNNDWITKLQFYSYGHLVDFVTRLFMHFVDYGGNGLIDGKIVKYGNQLKENNKSKVQMETRVIPVEKDKNYKFCRIVVHSRECVPMVAEVEDEKVKVDDCVAVENKYEQMKNGIIKYYTSFNQMSTNYAPWLTDNSKYIGYIRSTTAIFRYCQLDGWGEIFCKDSNDKLNEYKLICKCHFKYNEVLLSSIIDLSYRETVRNFMQRESSDHSNLNEDIMFSNKDHYTTYVENELTRRIIETICRIVKYQKNCTGLYKQGKPKQMINTMNNMFNVWFSIMNIDPKNVRNSESNATSVGSIKVNFFKSICNQIANLIECNNNNQNQSYVPFSRLYDWKDRVKAFGCHNSDFTKYLMGKDLLSKIDDFGYLARSVQIGIYCILFVNLEINICSNNY